VVAFGNCRAAPRSRIGAGRLVAPRKLLLEYSSKETVGYYKSERYSCWGSQPDQSGCGSVEPARSRAVRRHNRIRTSQELVVDIHRPAEFAAELLHRPRADHSDGGVGDVLHTSAGPGGYAAFRIPASLGAVRGRQLQRPCNLDAESPGVGNITSDGLYTAPAVSRRSKPSPSPRLTLRSHPDRLQHGDLWPACSPPWPR